MPSPAEAAERERLRRVLSRYDAILGDGDRRVELRPLLDGGAASDELIRPFGEGLINETYLVSADGARAVLQKVNPLFGFAVHEDIEAITAHLARKGLATPRLYRTTEGALAVDLGAEGVYRLMTFVPGETYSVMTRELAAPAGELAGRFHAALADLSHRFLFVRSGAHDLGRHRQNLRDAVRRASPRVTPPDFFALAEAVEGHFERLPELSSLGGPRRICHGDLKLNNLRFAPRDADPAAPPRGVCLLDLDTLAELPLAFELGDALRSWCNPAGEDQPRTRFDLELLEQALNGYGEHGRRFLTTEERAALVPGILRITLQLAARFLADVVNQSYFRFNPRRFPNRAFHNLLRGSGQLSLATSLLAQRSDAEAIVARALGRG